MKKIWICLMLGWTVASLQAAAAENPTSEGFVGWNANPGEYPVSLIDRPLALHPLMLELRTGEELYFIHHGYNVFGWGFGPGFGIVRGLETGLYFGLDLAPEANVRDMPWYVLYDFGSFLDGHFQPGVRLTLELPFDTVFSMVLDFPMKAKLHEIFALTADVGFGFGLGDDEAFLFNFTFGPMLQPTEHLALSLLFGVNLSAHARHTDTLLPLSFVGTYAFNDKFDLSLLFGFWDLNHQGADVIQLMVSVAYRFQL
jgi:hypothetical protein